MSVVGKVKREIMAKVEGLLLIKGELPLAEGGGQR